MSLVENRTLRSRTVSSAQSLTDVATASRNTRSIQMQLSMLSSVMVFVGEMVNALEGYIVDRSSH